MTVPPARFRARAVRAAGAFLAAVLALIVPSRFAYAAEATTGEVLGAVTASSGIAVGAARVNASSPSGRYTTTTDARGRFALLGLTPDTYVLSVEAPGYDSFAQTGLTILPGGSERLTVRLVARLHTIGVVHASGSSGAFSLGGTSDEFTVSSAASGGRTPPVSSSGLATYLSGTVQGAISGVPGVQLDTFANAILRGGQVDDAVFDFDSVPIPQGLVAEPGGNVAGAQLPTTGIASTTVTLAGYQTQGDNALGGVVDQIPAVGAYPGSGSFEIGNGIGATQFHELSFLGLGATPDRRWRYALASTSANDYFTYGDGHTFYPAEAATYGVALQNRSQYSLEGNVHFAPTQRDDVALLALAGQAAYDQYDTPYAGQTFGAFDGATIKYPGEPSATAPVTFPAGLRGSFDILKATWVHSGAHTLSRVQLYRSQFGDSAGGPYWDENGFPNGTFSFSGQQGGRETGIGYDGDDVYGQRHHLRYGAEYRTNSFFLNQIVPTFDEVVRSSPTLMSYLAYAGDTWSASRRLDIMGALRLTGTRVVPGTGYAYSVGALDPHVSTVYRLGDRFAARVTFDRTTVAPKPLEADRYDSTNVDQNGNPPPFEPLEPETSDEYALSFEGTGRTQFRATWYAIDEDNRIDVLPFNYRQVIAGESQPSPIGIPTNVGKLQAHGVELWAQRGGFTLEGNYNRAYSSSAVQFAYNDLNAPAIAAGHLFPVSYVPDFTGSLQYEIELMHHRLRVSPALSYESGYPYGVGRMAWTFDPVTNRPVQVPNDNFLNPGSSYYFLQNPSKPFNAQTNPYIGNLGTPEGNDPNTLRTPPQTQVNVHVEGDVSPRMTLVFDVANLLGEYNPTAYQTNPYLIGPPGYAGGNPSYGAYYQSVIGSAQAYTLGNGVPTNDGVTQAVPWSYGRGGYVPQSYPLGRSFQLRLRYRI